MSSRILHDVIRLHQNAAPPPLCCFSSCVSAPDAPPYGVRSQFQFKHICLTTTDRLCRNGFMTRLILDSLDNLDSNREFLSIGSKLFLLLRSIQDRQPITAIMPWSSSFFLPFCCRSINLYWFTVSSFESFVLIFYARSESVGILLYWFSTAVTRWAKISSPRA